MWVTKMVLMYHSEVFRNFARTIHRWERFELSIDESPYADWNPICGFVNGKKHLQMFFYVFMAEYMCNTYILAHI